MLVFTFTCIYVMISIYLSIFWYLYMHVFVSLQWLQYTWPPRCLGTPSSSLARPTNARPVMEKVSHAFVIFFVCLGNALAMPWQCLGVLGGFRRSSQMEIQSALGSYQWVICGNLVFRQCQDKIASCLAKLIPYDRWFRSFRISGNMRGKWRVNPTKKC